MKQRKKIVCRQIHKMHECHMSSYVHCYFIAYICVYILKKITYILQAAKDGIKTATCQAKRESLFLPDMKTPSVDKDQLPVVDGNAQLILERYLPGTDGVALRTSADGNCFFHSLSIALFGNENFSTELRMRTCCKMFLNKDKYTNHPRKKDLWIVSPDYEEASIDCTYSGVYTSAWNMLAAADVIGLSIKSYYPSVNGQKDKTHQI